jgi:hypothetical protein
MAVDGDQFAREPAQIDDEIACRGTVDDAQQLIPPPEGMVMPRMADFAPPLIAMPAVAVPPIAVPAGAGFFRSPAKISSGLRKEKSCSMTTTSWTPASPASRTISGAVISRCSCIPWWECIQKVPGKVSGKS